jgi:hypothetical protein
VTDFLIERDGYHYDLALTDGDAVLTHTLGRPAEVSQRITFRLLTNLGECPYDLAAGVAWVGGVFGAYPVDGIAGLLTLQIAQTEGVDEVIDPVFDLPTAARTLTITCEVRVTGEDEPVAVDLLVSVG